MPDAGAACAPIVLVVEVDPALRGLIEEWLEDSGYRVAPAPGGASPAPGRIDAVILDLPFLRELRASVLERLAHSYSGVPVLALSSGVFSGVEANGAVARGLGVAAVLPKPVGREVLIDAVASLLRARRPATSG